MKERSSDLPCRFLELKSEKEETKIIPGKQIALINELALAFNLEPKITSEVGDNGAYNTNFKEFDPGSGRTLAARLTHASRTEKGSLLPGSVADG